MDVSIVMCTRNRGDRVVPAVASILRDPGCAWEAFVIDQSETDATERALANAGLLAHPHLRYQRVTSVGASRARNTGLWQARGAVVAFTDDDCVVPPAWARAMADHFAKRPDVAVLYTAVRAAPLAEPGWVPDYAPKQEGYIRPSTQVICHLGLTANFAVRRAAVAVLGGFDELLGPGAPLIGGEDVDIGYRALRLGLGVYAAHEPAVTHYGQRRGGEITLTGSRYLYGMAVMCLKHVRCGDRQMLVPVARELAYWLGEGTGHLLRGRRPSGYRAAAAIGRGIVASLRYRVDTETRLYGSWRTPLPVRPELQPSDGRA